MSFSILAVRESGSQDGPLYPKPGKAADRVAAERRDGRPLPAFTTKDVRVCELRPGGTPKRVMRLHHAKARVTISESRIVVACSKYEKGGGWTALTWGAVPVTMTANVVSRFRAKRRRRGKMLVGHVRYPWLVSVGVRPGLIGIGRETLRLGCIDPSQSSSRWLTLDIRLPRALSGVELARDIAKLVASYRLDYESDVLDGALRARLRLLEKPAPLKLAPKQFASHFFVDASRHGLAKGLRTP